MNRKWDIGQALNTLANVGVIAGIAFLAFELNQNNVLLELEAEATRVEIVLDGWNQITNEPGFAELLIKDRSSEVLTEAEEFRLNAYWMGYLIRQQWQFQHARDSTRMIAAMHRIFSSYGSARRTWNGDGNASRAAGKDNFTPEFVRFVDEKIIVEQSKEVSHVN